MDHTQSYIINHFPIDWGVKPVGRHGSLAAISLYATETVASVGVGHRVVTIYNVNMT